MENETERTERITKIVEIIQEIITEIQATDILRWHIS